MFKQNQVLAMVQGPGRDYIVMKLIKTDFEEFVIETASLRDAVNANEQVPEYDSNYVLRRKGMPELDEIQKNTFDSWWDLFAQIRFANKFDNTITYMDSEALRPNLKQLFAEHDADKDMQLNKVEGRAFMMAAWDKANEAYRKSPGVEPAFQVEIKL